MKTEIKGSKIFHKRNIMNLKRLSLKSQQSFSSGFALPEHQPTPANWVLQNHLSLLLLPPPPSLLLLRALHLNSFVVGAVESVGRRGLTTGCWPGVVCATSANLSLILQGYRTNHHPWLNLPNYIAKEELLILPSSYP